MAYSYVRYTGSGSAVNYPFLFPYISRDHIKVRVNGSLVTNWSFLSASTVQFASAPANGAIVEIRRETPQDSAIVDFTDGSVLLERDLDLLATWQLYVAQETEDDLADTIRVDAQGRFNAITRRIINVGDPINAQDAVTRTWAETAMSSQLSQATAQASAAAGSATAAAGSANAAASSASSASTSASAASTSATNAAASNTAAQTAASSATTSAATATTQASTATTQATAAANSASSASSSAISASNSATSAAASLDAFDDRYLGSKATAPSLDNDGMTLLVGATYWNSTSNKMFAWSGSSWIDIAPQQAVGTQQITATGGQTSFTVAAGYNPNSVYVYLNGVLLDAADYTATNGSTVVLGTGATAGDTLRVVTFYSPVDTVAIRDAAAASATAAASSATAASTSASSASASATNAANSASTAATAASDPNVIAVAGNLATVTTVGSNIASVNTTALNIGSIISNQNNMAAIQGASANAATASAAATTATTQATAAAASAAAASAVVLGNEPVRPLIRPSLLLDFANTKQLDPRITFTRASTGTFYDGRTTAKAEENLLLQSHEFDNAVWGKIASTVTANSTTAPDGNSTADTITASSGSGRHLVFEQLSATQGGVQHTVSVFLKQGTATFGTVCFSSGGANPSAYATAVVNLGTGVITQTSNGVAATGVSSSISSVGNGWYRVVLNVTIPNGDGAVLIGISDSGTPTFSGYSVYNWTAVGTETIFVWGAQLEQRSSVTAYTATTTAPITNYIPALQTAAAGVPRFEHDPITGNSLGLEIEEQRTNLLLRSEEFDNAAWAKFNGSITTNSVISPNGTLTADTYTADGTNSAHITRATVTLVANTTYALSIYVKPAGNNWGYLTVGGTGAGGYSTFNYGTGTLGSLQAGLVSRSIIPVGNGWYRATIVLTTGASVGSNHVEFSTSPTETIGVVATSGGITVWGAQLEAGAFATSYIPTVASQVTRSADAASITGTNFSNWYRADEGAMYAEFASNATAIGGVFALNEGAGSQTIDYRAATGFSTVFAAGSTQANISIGTGNSGAATKVAVAYARNDYAGTRNGGSIVSDSSVILPVGVNTLRIGSIDAGGFPLSGTIRKLAYFPARVTNAQLQSLTTV